MSAYRRPEPAAPLLPRTVTRRPQAIGAIRWFQRLFILPHTMIGTCFFFVLLFLAITTALGHEETGYVDHSEVVSGRGKTGIYYERVVTFTYGRGDDQRQGKHHVYLGAANPGNKPDPAYASGTPVRLFRRGPGDFFDAEMLDSGDGSRAVPLLFAALFCAFWCSIVGIFVYKLWISPILLYQAYRAGRILPGRLLTKRSTHGRNNAYYVDYEFSDGDQSHQKSMQVSTPALWNQVSEGQPISVVCPKKGLLVCAVYECGDYDCTPLG